MTEMSDQPEAMLIFITSPEGRIVKNAHVVISIIGQNGFQVMRRPRPFKGAYLIDTALLPPVNYRLEAEVVMSGWLLTEEFSFQYA